MTFQHITRVLYRIALYTIQACIAACAVYGLAILGFIAWHTPTIHDLLVRYWWAPFSAAYTIGGLVWTVRAERLLRKLRREQTVQAWAYDDLRHDVDDIENFLENGNTLRQIPVIPLRKRVQ